MMCATLTFESRTWSRSDAASYDKARRTAVRGTAIDPHDRRTGSCNDCSDPLRVTSAHHHRNVERNSRGIQVTNKTEINSVDVSRTYIGFIRIGDQPPR